jgi:hypothetical protein
MGNILIYKIIRIVTQIVKFKINKNIVYLNLEDKVRIKALRVLIKIKNKMIKRVRMKE